MRLTLNGIVASDDDVEVYSWFGYSAFSPKALREALANLQEGEALTVEINSPGGSVDAGSEIYSLLRGSSAHTVAEIQSLAASAASYMAMGADEVVISPAAQMMIHLPSCYTEGDRSAHLKSIGMLDATREAILNTYELHAKGKSSRDELRRMMNAETWLSAQDAVDKGLADRLLGEGEEGASHSNLAAAYGLPDLSALRAKYARLKETAPATGKKPDGAENGTGWTLKARLDLEKNRF